MEVLYSSFERTIGYNCKDDITPFYLLEPIYFVVSYGKTRLPIQRIDETFKSDGCTIPKIFRWLFGCAHTNKYLPASIIHDWLLTHPETINYNRNLSSRIFRCVLRNEGVNPLKANIMYYAVDFWQWLENFKTQKWR